MSSLDLTIAEILRNPALEVHWTAPKDPPSDLIKGFSTDSRTLIEGEIFVALIGENMNGHNFVYNAFEKGCSAAIVNRAWYQEFQSTMQNRPLLIVADTLRAFQQIAKFYRLKFVIPALAITGSTGKTTTKEMTFAVLSQKFRVLKNEKSFNNHVGVPATLLALRIEHQVLLSELGSNHFGEMERLCDLVRPDIAILTNIGYAHLEFFKDLPGVAKEKMQIFSHANPAGKAIFNLDDPILAEQVYPVAERITFGLNRAADVYGEILSCDREAHYTIRLLERNVRIPIPGHHSVYNALAAGAAGLALGLTADDIVKGISSAQAVDKRTRLVNTRTCKILDDSYNANPTSCHAALATLSDMEGRRKIAVLGDMKELGDYTEQEHRKLATTAAGLGIQALFLYGEATRFTMSAAKNLPFQFVSHYSDKKGLLNDLSAFLMGGDVVLVKGSRSMQMEQVVDGLLRSLEQEF